MAEPDAVPLPREGEVFFDVRGEARSMRLSWYANSRVAVFSIWQGNRCTGTFRLPLADLERMVTTLQAGPPVPSNQRGQVSQVSREYGSRYAAEHPYGDDRFASGYAGAPAYSAPSPKRDAAASYEPGPGYGTSQPYAAEPSYPAYTQAQPYRADLGYGDNPAYNGGQAYPHDQYYSSAQPDPSQPGPAQPNSYGAYQPGGYSQSLSEDGAGAGAQGNGAQAGYGPSDYDPPNYSEPARYATADRPGSHRRASHSDDYGDPGSNRSDASLRQSRAPVALPEDPESMPDTAMLSFPSVPARNGPGAYR